MSISSLSFTYHQHHSQNICDRCWGLTKVEEFDEVPSVKAKAKKIKTAEQCQELCCELGDACITYQFWEGSGKCLIGKEVRLGKEHGSTPLWCEPHAPHKWNGRKKLSSSSSSSTGDVGKKQQQCGWGEELPYQCWDFGDERVNKTGGRLNARECAAACCQTENCIAWQELPGRGCFYNVDKLDGLDCDKSIEVYDGRRKKRASG